MLIVTPTDAEKKAFFDHIRRNLFGRSLDQKQVDGINHLWTYMLIAPFTAEVNIQQISYCFATFQHETASTMQPIKEYGGARRRYAPWYGRGYVQLTWETNYRKQQKKLEEMELVQERGIPWQVHERRELALHPDTSAIISIWGMIDGDFTGRGLSRYINAEKVDYYNARRIVNGVDRAQKIAGMAGEWETAIRQAL